LAGSSRSSGRLTSISVPRPGPALDARTLPPCRSRAAFTRTVQDGVPYEPEVRLYKGDGSYIWTQSYGRVVRDAHEPALLTGVTCVARTRTARERRQRASTTTSSSRSRSTC
jgi:PAS domain-containing protein